MKFDKQTLKCRNTSKAVIEKLESRQRGGNSGGLGYEYQKRFALWRLIESASQNLDVPVDMETLCWVDDVYTEYSDGPEYTQCKISPSDTWTSRKHKLKKEFVAQKKLLEKFGVTPYKLLLVAADIAHVAKLSAEIPGSVGSVSSVQHFPHPDPLHHPWKIPQIAAGLNKLLPPLKRDSNSREQLYKAFSSETFTPWQVISSFDLINAIEHNSPTILLVMPSKIVKPWYGKSREKWDIAEKILRNIKELEIDLSGEICCFRAGHLSGVIAKCRSRKFEYFVDSVISKKPLTVAEFMEVLPYDS